MNTSRVQSASLGAVDHDWILVVSRHRHRLLLQFSCASRFAAGSGWVLTLIQLSVRPETQREPTRLLTSRHDALAPQLAGVFEHLSAVDVRISLSCNPRLHHRPYGEACACVPRLALAAGLPRQA